MARRRTLPRMPMLICRTIQSHPVLSVACNPRRRTRIAGSLDSEELVDLLERRLVLLEFREHVDRLEVLRQLVGLREADCAGQGDRLERERTDDSRDVGLCGDPGERERRRRRVEPLGDLRQLLDLLDLGLQRQRSVSVPGRTLPSSELSRLAESAMKPRSLFVSKRLPSGTPSLYLPCAVRSVGESVGTCREQSGESAIVERGKTYPLASGLHVVVPRPCCGVRAAATILPTRPIEHRLVLLLHLLAVEQVILRLLCANEQGGRAGRRTGRRWDEIVSLGHFVGLEKPRS